MSITTNNQTSSLSSLGAGRKATTPRGSGRRGRAAASSGVKVVRTTITLPTYLPAAPDTHPMFLEKRVYQGSSGKVYPLPFTDRIAENPVNREWQAVWIENKYVRALVLPELGGRIHVLRDKTNGYDLIYNQPVIKPALVGLAGPWVSGGIEFNWPQHHRPATFLPVDVEIETDAGGGKTIWCGDHDPMTRMKGMHGVCLHPERACLELKVRAYNRTPYTQTFLWWANVATRVHEAYQSFFPPDVYCVADHARRSMSEYPLAKGYYYGVNYGERGRSGIPRNEMPGQFTPPHCSNKAGASDGKLETPGYAPNDLSFYANIPAPTSYMCIGSKEDFFGGYDHAAQAGLVHIANHRIAPGKKQWTWGNHEFGYAWDRNLTDPDARGEYGPYIEIMAGVYTDNQPDFSFLRPGETKTWSQFWYPIQKIGPAQHANLDAAVSIRGRARGGAAGIELGISVTKTFPKASIALTAKEGRPRESRRRDGRAGEETRPAVAHVRTLFSTTCDLEPGKPVTGQVTLPEGVGENDLHLRVTNSMGGEIIAYQPRPRAQGAVPPPATEPPPPGEMASADELFITGLHLEQYRHATRSPALYWREALRRDPLDARCNNAMGQWHLKRGEFSQAEKHFRSSLQRLTRRNANPYDGEVLYNLGLCLRFQNRDDEAYDAFYKACWNQAWMAAGYHALAEIDCCRRNWAQALDHLDRSLRFNTDNLRARNLKVMVLQMAGQGTATPVLDGKAPPPPEAAALLKATLQLDPLDWWAKYLSGKAPADGKFCDLQTRLDMAHDFARAGFFAEAIDLIEAADAQTLDGFNGRHDGRRGGVAVDLDRPDASKTSLPDQSWGALPLLHYTLGWLYERTGREDASRNSRQHAMRLAPDYCFPARLEEIAILESATRANPRDGMALYYLGNLLYDRRRHAEAIKLWEASARLEPGFSIVWRNLGIGYFNIRRQPGRARAAYERAFKANPGGARLLYERDQLWKRLGDSPAKRLKELERRGLLVQQRDDLCVEFGSLLNQTGRHAEAARLLAQRNFQPWEGGEGGPLGLHVRTQLALGREAMRRGAVDDALLTAADHFRNALAAPPNLGEAKHLLANQSDIHYWLGVALDMLGDKKLAREHWLIAASLKGDFQEMSTRAFSEMTFYSGLARAKLGQKAKARKLFQDLLAYAKTLRKTRAKIDYFATSLPAMLLFDDDLQFRQETTAMFLQAQARLGLGEKALAKKLLRAVLRRDPSHGQAAEFCRDIQLADR